MIDKKLLADVIRVYSVSHANQTNNNIHITFRETEDDNSQFFDLNIHELIHLYKLWAYEKGFRIASSLIKDDTDVDTYTAWDLDRHWLEQCGTSEIKCIREVCEDIFNKELKKNDSSYSIPQL